MRPQPIRRYSKTDLRRGTIAPVRPATTQTQVAADEQAALFGETASEATDVADPKLRDDQDSRDARV